MTETKICLGCNLPKPLDEFSPQPRGKFGRTSRCRVCCNQRYQKVGRNRNLARESELRRRYGIGIEDYEGILRQQGGVCAICEQPETVRYADGRVRRLAVDHDPRTGKVRGLLCGSCNRRLGFFDSEWSARAMRYWKRRKP